MASEVRTALMRAALAILILLPLPAVAQDGPVTARHHMVATANPLASAAALGVLRAGGSAVDAAVAAQMALGVVEPQSSGLGGGSLLLVWDAAAHKLSYYEGLASAPADVPENWTHAPDGDLIPARVRDRTGRVVGVPGTLPTLGMLHARYGKLPWARLFDAAIGLAGQGFALPPYLHRVLKERPELAHVADIGGLYFGADGQPLAVGTMLRNPALADTLRRVAAEGPDTLSVDPFARDIAAAVASGPFPGRITQADLAGYQPKERTPVCAVAFGHRICSAAPPSAGGIALLQLLVIADDAGIAAAVPGSVEAAHLFLEAARLSEADRRAYIGDPDQVHVPVVALLDPGYLRDRAQLISRDRAMEAVHPGVLPGEHGERPVSDPGTQPATTDIAIVDDAGDAVSFTTTINLNFGADRMVDGFVLNDALTNFAAVPVVDGVRMPNAIAPGKRPITTMAPTIVFGRDGRPELVVGAGGGARIIDSVAETIIGVLAWGQDVRTAIVQPRVGGENRAQELERGTAAADLAAPLRAMGHAVKVVEMNAGVQGIEIGPDGLRGWADPRRDGVAVGD